VEPGAHRERAQWQVPRGRGFARGELGAQLTRFLIRRRIVETEAAIPRPSG
jgi:hypothetical protein